MKLMNIIGGWERSTMVFVSVGTQAIVNCISTFKFYFYSCLPLFILQNHLMRLYFDCKIRYSRTGGTIPLPACSAYLGDAFIDGELW